MKEYPDILIGKSSDIRRGGFTVNSVDKQYAPGEMIEDCNVIFEAGGSQAGDWIAIGVVLSNMFKGIQTLLVRHPEDRFDDEL